MEVPKTAFNGVVVAYGDGHVMFVVKSRDVCDFFVFVVVATIKDVFQSDVAVKAVEDFVYVKAWDHML